MEHVKLASTRRIVAVYVGGEHMIVAAGMLPTLQHRVEVRQCSAQTALPVFEVVCWPSAAAGTTTEYVAYLRAALGPKAPSLIVRDADGEHEVALRELCLFAPDARLATDAQPNAAPLPPTGKTDLGAPESDLWHTLLHEKPSKMTFSPAPEDAAGEWELLRRRGLR